MQLKRNKEMEFQTLKKSHKKQIIIGALAICVIGGALTFATTRAKYKLTQDIDLARGTVNYKVPDLNMMAMYQENASGGWDQIDTAPTSGYTLNTTQSQCSVGGTKDTSIGISYSGSKVTISNLTKKGTKCYLYFDKKISIDNASELLAKVQSEAKTGTPTTFASGATTDEGVYSVSDPVYGGTSYYWRGAVTNNYVKFADKCWRIVRINGDGSMRLIYDGTVCHANGSSSESIAVAKTPYNSNYNNSSYVGWTYTASSQRPSPSTGGTASNAKTQLESWYNSNITGTNATKVVAGKYCNDRNVQSGDTWSATGSQFYYAAYKRIITDHAPSLACNSSDVYTLNVGLITVDEAMYAGGTNGANSSYYLYNGQNYWTMSPYRWSGNWASVFDVNMSGYLANTDVYVTSYDLRPVINLKADTLFATGGTGTQNNPYVVQ